MRRRDTLYLLDMLEATRAIGSFIEQLQPPDRHRFVADDLVRSAVLQKLSVTCQSRSATPIAHRLLSRRNGCSSSQPPDSGGGRRRRSVICRTERRRIPKRDLRA